MKHHRMFEAALGECLDALFAGATVEECLARYPNQAEELQPLLRVALEIARTPTPAMPQAAFEHSTQRLRQALAARRDGRPAGTAPRRDLSGEPIVRPRETEQQPRQRRSSGLLDAVILAVVLVAITLTFGMPFLNDIFLVAMPTPSPTVSVGPTGLPMSRTPLPTLTGLAGIVATSTPPASSPTAETSAGTTQPAMDTSPESGVPTPGQTSQRPDRLASPTVERQITPRPTPTGTPAATTAPSHTPVPSLMPTVLPSVVPTDTPSGTPSPVPTASTPAPVTFSGVIMRLPSGGMVGTWVVNTYEYGAVRLQVTSQTQVEPHGVWLRPGDSLSAVARPAGEGEYVAIQVQVSAQEAGSVLLNGVIEAVDPQPSPIYIVVGGDTVHITAETEVQGPLDVGRLATIEGQRQADGSVLATRIRTTEPVATAVPPLTETPGWVPSPTPPVTYTPNTTATPSATRTLAPPDTPTTAIAPTATFEPAETPTGTDIAVLKEPYACSED